MIWCSIHLWCSIFRMIIFLKNFWRKKSCWNISKKYMFLSEHKINVKVTKWICISKGSHHKRQSWNMVAFIGATFHPKFLSYCIAQMIPSQSSSFDFFPGAQHSGKSSKFCKQQGLKLLFFRYIDIKMGSYLKNLFIVHIYDIWCSKEFSNSMQNC